MPILFWQHYTAVVIYLDIYSCNYCHAGESLPVKMFERTANLANNQIINYKCDPAEKWLVLIGIAPGSPEVRKLIWLFLLHKFCTSLLLILVLVSIYQISQCL